MAFLPSRSVCEGSVIGGDIYFQKSTFQACIFSALSNQPQRANSSTEYRWNFIPIDISWLLL